MAQQNLFGGAVIAGSTSVTKYFVLRSTTDNTAVTGKIFSDLTTGYTRSGASLVAITEATQTANGAWSSGGIVEVSSGTAPGLYRFDIPDAALIAGADEVVVSIVCSGTYGAFIQIPLTLEPGLTRKGTASGVAAQSITLESGAPNTTDEWKGAVIWTESATTGAGQAALCTTSTNANPPVLTLDRPWGITPTGTITYRAYKGSLPLTAIDVTDTISNQRPDVGAVASIDTNGIVATSFSAGAIDATAIASNAIAAAKIASGAITNAKFAAGAIDATAIASDAIAAAKIATGAITSAKFAAGAIDATAIAADAITAAKVAANAIGASELATDAVTEIVDAVFARAFSSAYASLTFDEIVKVMVAVLAGKASGLGTATETYRNLADSGDVVVATMTSSARTGVTRTP